MKRVSLICLLLGLTGCVTNSSDISEPILSEIAPPENWVSGTLEGSVSSNWLLGFGSDELINLAGIAVENNLSLQAGSFQVEAAEAAARIAKAGRYPNLNIDLNSGKQQSRFVGFNFQKVETEVHTLSLSSQWEIDLWNRIGNTTSAVRAQADAAAADLVAARLSLVALTSKSYFNAIAALKQLQLARENHELLENRFSTVKGRFDRGVADSSEYRAAEAQVAAAAASLASRQIQYDSAIRTLETILGDYPSGSLTLSSDLPKIENGIPSGLPSQLLNRRPDLVAEERRLAAQLLQAKAAKKNWLPRIALTGSLGTTSDQLSDVLDEDFSVWSLFGDLTTPLFSAGRLSAERDQERALAEASIRQYKDTVLTAFREVESALTSDRLLTELEMQQKRAADSFALSEDRIESLYERGTVDLFALVDARTRTLDAQTLLIDTTNRRLQNRVDLHIALGGGFE